jgi:hypothetical protein
MLLWRYPPIVTGNPETINYFRVADHSSRIFPVTSQNAISGDYQVQLINETAILSVARGLV